MHRHLPRVAVLGFIVAILAGHEACAGEPVFSTPSGNILCYGPINPMREGADKSLTCHVFSSDWMPPSSEPCDVDRTATVTLQPEGAAEESMVCHGDVFWPMPAPVLSYGSVWSVWGYRCEVARSGVTCTNASGHGFAVSRGGRRLF